MAMFVCAVLPASAMCWDLAEHTYGIEKALLKSIAIAESNMNPVAYNVNKNGTYDIGMMQINSSHLQQLEKKGITEAMLSRNACISLMVGASILSEMKNRYEDLWEAVGAYNAGTSPQRKSLREKYADKIRGIYLQQSISGG